jgi:uncharacterized protein (TIGR03437 family)
VFPRIFCLLAAAPLFAATSQTFALLPAGAVANAIQSDSTGSVYVAGTVTPSHPKGSADTQDVFVGKLSADGSKLIYFTTFGGSNSESAAALVVAADGSVYVAGPTKSTDFPLTPANSAPTGFVARIGKDGSLTNAAYVVSDAKTAPVGLALNGSGNVLVSGLAATAAIQTSPPGGYIVQFDSQLSGVIASTSAYGGLLTVDANGNIYVAGEIVSLSFSGNLPPLTTGSFQPTHALKICGDTGGPVSVLFLCSYLYAAKLDPTMKPVWATYVTGTWGAVAHGILVDANGSVTVAGETNSDDFPVTAGSFQTIYEPVAPPAVGSTVGPSFGPPPITGFVTKLKADGTGLVWSTYFGGSTTDSIEGLALSPSGVLYVSGKSKSGDLPGLSETPPGCRPASYQQLEFVGRLAADGTTSSATQLLYGLPVDNYGSSPFIDPRVPVTVRADGVALTSALDGSIDAVDFGGTSRLACITDPATNLQIKNVAPGQLISLFGTDLMAPQEPTLEFPTPAPLVAVSFNRITAPFLYTSPDQLNLQVPYEVAGAASAQLQVSNSSLALPLLETRTVPVVAMQPEIFVLPPSMDPNCLSEVFSSGAYAVARNADGSLNSCTNPATVGSTVTLFVNGLGVISPALGTGTIAPSPAAPVTPPVNLNVGFTVNALPTSTVPGTIDGVQQVKLPLTGAGGGNVSTFLFSVGPAFVPVPVHVWVSSN